MRNASTHAAGVVIGDRPLDELVPLYQDPRSSMPATQFNMKWAEKAGLVKFDFLGLRTLTVIQYTLDFLRIRGIDIDISAIDLTDKKTFDLYSAAEDYCRVPSGIIGNDGCVAADAPYLY